MRSDAPIEFPSAAKRSEGDFDPKARILEAGIACIVRFGTEKTSLQDVADTAGVSRATVYRHFHDRDELFHAITHYEIDLYAKALQERVQGIDTLEELIAIVIEENASRSSKYRDRIRTHDSGLAQLHVGRSLHRTGVTNMIIEPFVRKAAANGDISNDLTAEEAIEWIAIAISTVGDLVESDVLDLNDSAAVGRFYAARICHGLLPQIQRPRARKR